MRVFELIAIFVRQAGQLLAALVCRNVSGRDESPRLGRSGSDAPCYPEPFQTLEPRLLLSAVAAPPVGGLDAWTAVPAIEQDVGLDNSAGVNNNTVVGLTPSQVRQAYGFNQITFTKSGGQTITGDGRGQTIAIVDACDDPNIFSDFQYFNKTFNLPTWDSSGKSLLTKVTMGASVKADSGWALEIALDVEWAHAMAPQAHILLVEAPSASLTSLLSAVDYARKQPNVVAVSMSWGGSEFSSETAYDSYFTTPAGHAGVSFFASSGDTGSGGLWPSVSPKVISVGGTTLKVNASGNYLGETGWSGSGGCVSRYETEPGYQLKVQSSGRRNAPDVAYDGDPASGLAVYDSFAYQGRSGWFQIGGTSAGAPQWAALTAIADQGRAWAGKSSLDGFSQTLPGLYSLPAADFHDILSGSNGGYKATAGYDKVTGLGSPRANLIAAALAALGGTTTSSALTATVKSSAVTAKALQLLESWGSSATESDVQKAALAGTTEAGGDRSQPSQPEVQLAVSSPNDVNTVAASAARAAESTRAAQARSASAPMRIDDQGSLVASAKLRSSNLDKGLQSADTSLNDGLVDVLDTLELCVPLEV
jgi:hypothetical protein